MEQYASVGSELSLVVQRESEISDGAAYRSPRGTRCRSAWRSRGCSIRQYQQALYDFEKERWRRGEADSHPFDRDIYPSQNGKY